MPVRVASSLLGTVDLVTGTNLYWLISRNKASIIPGADADAQARIHPTNTAEPYPVQLGLYYSCYLPLLVASAPWSWLDNRCRLLPFIRFGSSSLWCRS